MSPPNILDTSHTTPPHNPLSPQGRYFSHLISQTRQATSSHLPSFSLSPSPSIKHPSLHLAPRTIHHASSIPLPPPSPPKGKKEEEKKKTKPRRRQRQGAFSKKTTGKTARKGVDQRGRKVYRYRSVRSGWSPGGKSQGNAASSSRPFYG